MLFRSLKKEEIDQLFAAMKNVNLSENQSMQVLRANDRTVDLFVTFITTTNPRKVVGQIKYDGSVSGNPTSTGGVEQPVWDGKTGKFYISIPATTDHANGEVDEIDPVTMKITHRFPSGCAGPAGLVLIPDQHLMTSCGDVLDILAGQKDESKAFVLTVPNVGGDEIWFNRGGPRQRVFPAGHCD